MAFAYPEQRTVDAITTVGATVEIGAASLMWIGDVPIADGSPTSLIADGGTLSFSSTGTIMTTGAFSAPVQLAPQTLYFFAVGCSHFVTLSAAGTVGSLSASLIGAPNFTANSTSISTNWSFMAGGFPTIFGPGTITSAPGLSPNVFAGP